MNKNVLIIATLFLGVTFWLGCNKDAASNDPSVKTATLLAAYPLSESLKECSGVEMTGSATLWLHNDAGNDPILYAVDPQGQQTRTLQLTGVQNTDWEDLARDEADNLYVGNFGNNDNDRTDLAIYKIPPPEQMTDNTYTPEVIHFSYEDQTDFPPEESEHFYDSEAFFAANGHLYLFTKDRSKPFFGLTTLYEVPAEPGTHTARRMGSFQTSDKKKEGAITSADISPDGTVVALLAKEVIWLFTDVTPPNYLSGESEQIAIEEGHQFEGLVFKDSCTLYLTSEREDSGEMQLFHFALCD